MWSDDWTIVRSATQHEMANPARLGSVADFWAVEEKKLGAVRTLQDRLTGREKRSSFRPCLTKQ